MTIPATVTGALLVSFATDPGGPWTRLWLPADLGAIKRTRRFALPPGFTVQARYVQIAVIAGPDGGWGADTFNLAGVNLWWEQPCPAQDIGDVRLWNFNFDDAAECYTLVATAGNVDVYRQGVRQAAIPSPYAGGQLPTVTRAQALDTLISFRTDTPPTRFMRQGSDISWDSRPVSFSKLPLYDYTGLKAGAVAEEQQITLTGFTAGDTWNITFEGQTTASIPYPPSGGDISGALEVLDGVGAGNVSVAGAGDSWTVSFVGDLLGVQVDQMAPSQVVSAAGTAFAVTTQQAQLGGEPIISAARGYPACGSFYQQRLWMMGLQQLPETLMGSGVGQYFNFNYAPAQPDGSIVETIDTDQVTSIVAAFPGQHLQIFSTSAEFYAPSEPLAPPVAVKRSGVRGSAAGVPPFMITNDDGGHSTLFLGAGGNALYMYSFNFAYDNYVAPNIAVNAAQVVKDVIDAGWRKHRSTDECDLGVMPRADGQAAVMVALRDQDVCGYVPWSIDGGRFLAASGELNGDMYVAVGRILPNGKVMRTLEFVDSGRLLDSSVAVTAGAQTVTGLGHLEGLTVTAWVDGTDKGDFLVAGGQITLPEAAVSGGEVGRNFQPEIVTMPGVLQQDPRPGKTANPRVGDISLRLGPTANLYAGLVGGKQYRVPLRRPTLALGQGPGQDPFEGWARLEAIPGFRADAQARITQPRPGPFQIQELVMTVNT